MTAQVIFNISAECMCIITGWILMNMSEHLFRQQSKAEHEFLNLLLTFLFINDKKPQKQMMLKEIFVLLIIDLWSAGYFPLALLSTLMNPIWGHLPLCMFYHPRVAGVQGFQRGPQRESINIIKRCC